MRDAKLDRIDLSKAERKRKYRKQKLEKKTVCGYKCPCENISKCVDAKTVPYGGKEKK